jgi:uncharacterized membrane protein
VVSDAPIDDVDPAPPQPRRAPSATTHRLEAFSDAVLAIAITLLVLEISVPESRSGHLFDDLLDAWPSYVAFILSFVVIGIMWVSHHSMFERIARVDRGLLFTNLLLLLGIAFLPFPTALLASYAEDGGSNASVAAAVYSGTMVAIGLAFTGMWMYLDRHRDLLIEGIDPALLGRSVKRSFVGPVVYALSIGLAFVSAVACFFVYAGVAIYFAWGPSSRILHPHSQGHGHADSHADAPDAR